MTRAATRKNEEFLLHIARNGTAGHVERLVSHYRRTNRLQALQEENRSHALRELSWYTDDDGMWVLIGRWSGLRNRNWKNVGAFQLNRHEGWLAILRWCTGTKLQKVNL